MIYFDPDGNTPVLRTCEGGSGGYHWILKNRIKYAAKRWVERYNYVKGTYVKTMSAGSGISEEDTGLAFDLMSSYLSGEIIGGGIKVINGTAKTTGEAVSNLGKSYGKFGTVIENPGVKVTGFSGHSVNQAITRGITTDVMQNTVKNPVVVLSQHGGNSFAYVSNEAVVVVKNTGEIITTYGKSNFDAIVQQVLKEAIK